MTEPAMWDLGALTQEEYEALFTALTYYADFETLGEPDADDPQREVAKQLLDRLVLPS